MRQTIKLASVISVALWMAACSPQEDKAAHGGAGPQSTEESPDDLQINHQIRVEAHLVA